MPHYPPPPPGALGGKGWGLTNRKLKCPTIWEGQVINPLLFLVVGHVGSD